MSHIRYSNGMVDCEAHKARGLYCKRKQKSIEVTSTVHLTKFHNVTNDNIQVLNFRYINFYVHLCHILSLNVGLTS